MNTKLNQVSAQPTAKCVFCGYEGNYPHEVMDVDYLDRTGHDTVVTACRDIDECIKRGGTDKPIYY